jgi:uncharacterized cupin superfamily protein
VAAGHPNIVHLDEVEQQVIEDGDLRGRRARVGAAAGARRAGLSRYLLGPGERAMPVHVHADEEEVFYVLAGSGLSWQDGWTYRVQAGDVLVHPPQGAAHALVGGDDGLDVLAFGTGSDMGMTWLPRARAWWMGPHWLPDDAPNPFAREAAAGPLELPDPEPGRPPHSAVLADTPAERTETPGYRETYRALAAAAGSSLCGLNYCELEPGQQGCPQHVHSAEEECYVVLAGEGEALLGDETYPLRAGSVVWRPPASGVAHAVRAGAETMTYLVFGTRRPGEWVYYPRSKKVNLRGSGGAIFRVEPLAYLDGEELE